MGVERGPPAVSWCPRPRGECGGDRRLGAGFRVIPRAQTQLAASDAAQALESGHGDGRDGFPVQHDCLDRDVPRFASDEDDRAEVKEFPSQLLL